MANDEHVLPPRYARLLREALVEIRRLRRSQPAAPAAPAPEAIAVVGIGLRLPGPADEVQTFWRQLCDGHDAVTETPDDRPGSTDCPRGGYIEHPLDFDAEFFAVSAREARSMDPRQRVLLEVTQQALEDAGLRADELRGTDVGVYVGTSGFDYALDAFGGQSAEAIDAYASTGCAASIVANRLSYVWDLRGPSVAVDTACSSALVAAQQAIDALRAGHCSMALVGGVHLNLRPEPTVALARFGMLSPEGRCKTFDASADGFVPSEGCGMLVLAPLSEARRRGLRVYALLRGGAVNQDGRSNGLTAPNARAQRDVIERALADAGVDPASVGFVEAHGTGTPLGDPIEIEAISAVYGARPTDAPCAIGSVKTNLGHLEAAAGIAGLIKATLAVYHGRIPANLHLRELNPAIELDAQRFQIPTQTVDWPAATPRRAAVSAFGFGGTNAHVVLEQAPADAGPAPLAADHSGDAPHTLLLSAHTADALHDLAERWAAFLDTTELPLGVLCAAAALQRDVHPHRLAVVADDRAEAARRLRAHDADFGRVRPGHEGRVAFVFPGQGSQWVGMGRALLETEPVFRQALDDIDAIVRQAHGWSPLDVLHGHEGARSLDEVDVVQPVIFAVQVGLARQWIARGVRPDAIVGTSMGEVAAAHVAGRLSLPDAVRVICERSRVIAELAPAGAMLAVELTGEEATRRLASGALVDVEIAVVNGPDSLVLAGSTEAIEAAMAVLEAERVFCQRIDVDYASHSRHVESLDAPVREALGALTPTTPTVGGPSMLSTTTLAPLDTAEAASADYWMRNLRQPVRLWPAIARLLDEGVTTFVEISPHPVLRVPLENGLRATGRSEVEILPSGHRSDGERRTLARSLGRLFTSGDALDLDARFGRAPRAALPHTAWQRQRFAIEHAPVVVPQAPVVESAGEPLWPARPGALLYLERPADPSDPVGALSRALMAVLAACEDLVEAPALEALSLTGLPTGTSGSRLQVGLHGEAGQPLELEVYTTDVRPPQWTRVATGRVVRRGELVAFDSSDDAPARVRTRCERLDGHRLAWRGQGESLVQGASADEVLTRATDALRLAVPGATVAGAARATRVDRLELVVPRPQWPVGELVVHARVEALSTRGARGGAWLRDATDGRLLAVLRGLEIELGALAVRMPTVRATPVPRPVTDGPATHDEPLPAVRDAEWLRERVVALVAAETERAPGRIEHDVAFASLGIDSMMASQMRAALEDETGVRLSLHDLMGRQTVAELVELLAVRMEEVERVVPSASASDPTPEPVVSRRPSDWLVVPVRRPEAGVRLFTCPFAGGNASVFRPWATALPRSIELVSVELPARGLRLDDEPIVRMGEMADAIASAMSETLDDRPFAVYGHCSGALVMFEALRHLHARTGRLPMHFFCGASHVPATFSDAGVEAPSNDLPDGHIGLPELLEAMDASLADDEALFDLLVGLGFHDVGALRGDAELREIAFRTLRADIELVATYRHERGWRPEMPVTALGGSEDPSILVAELLRWQSETSGPFELVTLEGGDHYFMMDRRDEVIEVITEALADRNARRQSA